MSKIRITNLSESEYDDITAKLLQCALQTDELSDKEKEIVQSLSEQFIANHTITQAQIDLLNTIYERHN